MSRRLTQCGVGSLGLPRMYLWVVLDRPLLFLKLPRRYLVKAAKISAEI